TRAPQHYPRRRPHLVGADQARGAQSGLGGGPGAARPASAAGRLQRPGRSPLPPVARDLRGRRPRMAHRSRPGGPAGGRPFPPRIFVPLAAAGRKRRLPPALHLEPHAHQARAVQPQLARPADRPTRRHRTRAGAHHPRQPMNPDALPLVAAALLPATLTDILLRRRPRAWRVAAVVAVLLALLVPFGERSGAFYLRGAIGDLSIGSLAMMAYWFLRAWGPASLARFDRELVFMAAPLVLLAIVFYPMSLGLTVTDPYAHGY